jgi:hypothetical protein
VNKTSDEYSNFKYLKPMKDIFFSAIFFSVILSCSDGRQDAPLSYSKIGALKDSVSKTEPKESIPEDTFKINFNPYLFEQISGLKIDSVTVLIKNEVMDRVSQKNTEKVNIFIDSSTIQFKAWDFQDSTDLKIAWYNMLDCFGENCESIDLYDTLFQIDKYNLVFVSEKSIDWISSSCNIDKRDWILYLKKERIQPKYLYVFETLVDENIVWYNFDDRGMQPKTNTND